MTKQERKSDIGMMSVTAAMVSKIMEGFGVCAIHGEPVADENGFYAGKWQPCVHLTANEFMRLFGEDTEFEYDTKNPSSIKVYTTVNGVRFYALITNHDMIGGKA